MSTDIPARGVISRFPPGGKRKIGRPHIDWMQMAKHDISRRGFSWNDQPAPTADRKQWKELTALRISKHL